jgi:hypothetical protein
MTTILARSCSPRLPRPDAYKAHIDRILPDPRPRIRRRICAVLQLIGRFLFRS